MVAYRADACRRCARGAGGGTRPLAPTRTHCAACVCGHAGDLDDDELSALVHEDTLRQLAGSSAESSGLTCLKHALDGFCVVFNRGASQLLTKERADRMTDKRLELTLTVFLKDLGGVSFAAAFCTRDASAGAQVR